MTIPVDIAALGARAAAMIEELGAISARPDDLTRLFLTQEHRRAADLVARWMREAGLTVSEDALGTVRGHWHPAGADAPRLLVGSHIDTVANAGKYDGTLGVVLGILAVEAVAKAGFAPPYGIDVLAFGDEEGSRFPTTLSSSAAVAGVFPPASLAGADADGVTLREALLAYGKNPDDIAAAAYDPSRVIAYVEAHIEQGPVLEAENEAVGIVTAINAQSRAQVRVTGEAGHAGTVPMALRKDALTAAAEMALALEQIAGAHELAVGTVGVLRPEPGATNVVPGAAEFTIDFRAPKDETLAAMDTEIRKRFAEIAERRGVGLEIIPYARATAVPMEPKLQDALATGIARSGSNLAGRRLPSGAGHDAMAIAAVAPVAMLFVRNEKGISHSPLENMTEADAGIAIRVLIETILELAGRSQ